MPAGGNENAALYSSRFPFAYIQSLRLQNNEHLDMSRLYGTLAEL